MNKIPLHQIAGALAKRAASDKDEKKFAREVAAYLLVSGQTGRLNPLARDMVQARAEHGIVEVTAVSAHELSDSVKTDVETQIKKLYPNAKAIIINELRDPNIIGGVRLEFPDKQLDLSVRNKLNKFKALTA